MDADRRIADLEKRLTELEAKYRRLELAGAESPDLREAVRLIVERRDTSALDKFYKNGGRIIRH